MSSMSDVLMNFWNRYVTKYVSKDDVWNAQRVVCTLFQIVKCNSSNLYEIEIPKENTINMTDKIKTSRYYFYNQLISALGIFRENIEWQTVHGKDFLNCMVDEKFSDDKKKKVIDLLGDLSSNSQRKLSEETTFNIHSRIEMIRMLIRYVSATNEYAKIVWNSYYSFSPASSVIYEYTKNMSNAFIIKPIETAVSIIELLLGDAYDKHVSTLDLISNNNYPIISEKRLSELVNEEKYS